MMMLDETTRKGVKKIFDGLKNPVNLVVFSRDDTITVPGHECPTCKQNESLMQEISVLSDKIRLEIHDSLKDTEKAVFYGIDKIPATVVCSSKNYGIRLFGVPAGYEFATLVQAIQTISSSDSGLTQETRDQLQTLTNPVHIQVFITLSCPYCASAVVLAHHMAFESDVITADMVNAQEFPLLAQRYNVYAVPKVVINDSVQFEGALPEASFLQKIMSSVSP
jgi:glutaredoxin-like protein